MPDNKLLYSDTDSLFLEKPLNDSLISPSELGKFKLEHEVVEGYFIHPKFYAFKNSNGDTIIRNKGLANNSLSFEDFIKLDKGENLTIDTQIFTKNWLKVL